MNIIQLNKIETTSYEYGYLRGQLDLLLDDFIITYDEIQELIKDTLQTINIKIQINPLKYKSDNEYITLDELHKTIYKVQNEIIKGA